MDAEGFGPASASSGIDTSAQDLLTAPPGRPQALERRAVRQPCPPAARTPSGRFGRPRRWPGAGGGASRAARPGGRAVPLACRTQALSRPEAVVLRGSAGAPVRRGNRWPPGGARTCPRAHVTWTRTSPVPAAAAGLQDQLLDQAAAGLVPGPDGQLDESGAGQQHLVPNHVVRPARAGPPRTAARSAPTPPESGSADHRAEQGMPGGVQPGRRHVVRGHGRRAASSAGAGTRRWAAQLGEQRSRRRRRPSRSGRRRRTFRPAARIASRASPGPRRRAGMKLACVPGRQAGVPHRGEGGAGSYFGVPGHSGGGQRLDGRGEPDGLTGLPDPVLRCAQLRPGQRPARSARTPPG